MNRRVQTRIVCAALLFCSLGPGCASRDSGVGEVPTGVTGSFRSWLAVLAVAPSSNEFEELTQHVLEVAEASILVAPLVCIEGLPENVAKPSDYLLAVFASDRQSVIEIADRTGLEPVFVGEVTQRCVD